jgi:hypothetical protein
MVSGYLLREVINKVNVSPSRGSFTVTINFTTGRGV